MTTREDDREEPAQGAPCSHGTWFRWCTGDFHSRAGATVFLILEEALMVGGGGCTFLCPHYLSHEPHRRKQCLQPGSWAELGVTYWMAPEVTGDGRVLFQDVDAAYANKVELQAKVDTMDQDIKFFKCLFEAVSLLAPHSQGVHTPFFRVQTPFRACESHRGSSCQGGLWVTQAPCMLLPRAPFYSEA